MSDIALPQALTDITLETTLREHREDLAAIVFYAPWCPSCATFWGVMDEVAAQLRHTHGITLHTYSIDAEAYPHLARRYRVTAVPTTLFYHYGIRLREMIGARPAFAILSDLEDVLPDGR
jgi:thioredoxin 1